MKNLSKRQKGILDFIKKEIYKKGYPPTVREICDAVGLSSPSTVHVHLSKLEEKKYIRRNSTKSRAIEVIDCNTHILSSEKEVTFVPLVGNVTAGTPILAVENIEETYPIPTNFLDIDGQYFVLRIKGHSMILSGIHDGDLVLVKQQTTADNGEIAVALIEDSATVKTFYKEENYIRLQPENPDMKPIIVDDVIILGIVKGVFRKMAHL